MFVCKLLTATVQMPKALSILVEVRNAVLKFKVMRSFRIPKQKANTALKVKVHHEMDEHISCAMLEDDNEGDI